MGTAIKFRETNMILMPPKNAPEGTVYALPVMSNGKSCTSCWELTDEEIEYIKEHKKIWVQVMGNTHPPLIVFGESPLRDDIAEFTQIRLRNGPPTLEAIKKAGIEEVSVLFVDGERVWEKPHNLVDANSDEYRKIVAEKLLEVIAKGVVDANEGFAKMHAHKMYNLLFEDRRIVPNTLQLSFYIKREKFVNDVRNDTLENDMAEYMFFE